MINFSAYKAILWDFDGVILDSMPIRDKGFEITLSNFPKELVDQLLDFHRLNGGLSRYVKFRYFYEEILNEQISDELLQELTEKFSSEMMKSLIDPSLIVKDSFTFIETYYNKLPMHIVSGSDEKELREICRKLNIDKYFKSIDGSPTHKTQLISEILMERKYRNEHVVLIGDSVNDYDAAARNNIVFYGYNNQQLKVLTENYISDFRLVQLDKN